jgi:hypothetical protein
MPERLNLSGIFIVVINGRMIKYPGELTKFPGNKFPGYNVGRAYGTSQ